MKKFYFIGLTIILLLAVALIAYGSYLNNTDESHIEMQMENRTIPLRGELVKIRPLKPLFILDTINLTSEDMADAVSLIDGKIENVFIQKNSKVNQGQVLFEVYNEELPLKIKQVESAIAKAEAQVFQAKNSFARYERLKEKNATSLEKYDEAKLNYEAAQANLSEVQAQKEQLLVKDSAQQVLAPISGEVVILYKQIGAFITAGTPVALIANFSKLNFSLPIEDAAAKKFSVGETFELKFRNSRVMQKAYDTEYSVGNLGNSQNFPVFIRDIIPNLNQPAAMRKIIFEVDNSAGILEQQTYNGVSLSRTTPRNALTIPLAALSANKDFVFIVTKDNILEKRAIKTGADDGHFIEILSGLNEGEIVITSAQKGLEAGMKVVVVVE